MKEFYMDYLKNCETFLRRWKEDVRPEDVIPTLNQWTEEHKCGSMHCAGGWLPYMPEFAFMGVKQGSNGEPYINTETTHLYGWEVAGYLFGTNHLFDQKHRNESGTGHAVIISRFERQIVRLNQE